MSGKTNTYADRREDGEETEFKCLSIGHFFRKGIVRHEEELITFTSISVKTGKKTAFNLDDQKGYRIDQDQEVVRIHEFNATQTIED